MLRKPLAGIRVLDLTNVLAGPYACYQLVLLGADVIKVERPGTGDLARQLGADPARNKANMGISFLAQNAGKKSITLNLKADEGKALLKRLVGDSDVLVENYRPGVMNRLELGYSDLSAVNPELIYCAISGFGQGGPWKDDPAYDQIVQGISGVMSITGDAKSAPLRVGYPVADTIGGMCAAFTIAAALNARPRGAFLDISMTDSVISTMGWVVSNHLIGGVEPTANGNENTTSAPSGTFRTKDAPINVSANRDEQWESMARHLQRDDLLHNPDYATREGRKRNRHALREELEQVLTTRNAAEWVRELSALGVPTGPVLTLPEVLNSEQIQGRDLLAHYSSPKTGAIDVTAAPALVDGTRPKAEAPPPDLGQDNDTIYGALGLSPEEIAALKKKGVI